MPRPQFIICAESSSVDQEMNRLSIFNVVDGVTIIVRDGDSDAPSQPEFNPLIALNSLNFRVIAVWMRGEDDDPKHEYNYEFWIEPPGEPETQIGEGTFKFTTPVYRIQLHVLRGNPWLQTGNVKVTSKIRRHVEADRKHRQQVYHQDFWFPVTVSHVRKDEPPVIDANLN